MRRNKTSGLPPDATSSAQSAPPAEVALRALTQRSLRAVVFLFVRLVGAALLVSVLETRLIGVARYRTLVDGLAALLVVLPFFTAYGRVFAWRIALGRAYVREKRFADAERALSPLDRRGAYHPFDAAGEGVYWLALARRGRGNEADARRLLELLATQTRGGGGAWAQKAAEALQQATSAGAATVSDVCAPPSLPPGAP